MPAKKATSNEIVMPGAKFDPDKLAAITSFEDALSLVTEVMGEQNVARASEEIGDGFKLVDNKDTLIGVAMLLITWDFHMGDHGEFVSVKLVTKDNRKLIVNDGSSGIRDQLMSYTAKKNRQGGLFCDKGFRRSDYKYTDEKGEEKPATTYYLDTSV